MDINIINSFIAEYKSDFQRLDSEERYKWEAIKCFQDNWNPDAENFEEMLKEATAGTCRNNRSFSMSFYGEFFTGQQ